MDSIIQVSEVSHSQLNDEIFVENIKTTDGNPNGGYNSSDYNYAPILK